MPDKQFESLTLTQKAELLKSKIDEVFPVIISDYYMLYGYELVQEGINVIEFSDALEFMEIFCRKVMESSLPYEINEFETAKVLDLFYAILLDNFKNISTEDIRTMKPVCKEISKSIAIMNSALAKKIKACYGGFFKKLPAGG